MSAQHNAIAIQLASIVGQLASLATQLAKGEAGAQIVGTIKLGKPAKPAKPPKPIPPASDWLGDGWTRRDAGDYRHTSGATLRRIDRGAWSAIRPTGEHHGGPLSARNAAAWATATVPTATTAASAIPTGAPRPKPGESATAYLARVRAA